jgi:uncharacterized protein (TIGR03663 family)
MHDSPAHTRRDTLLALAALLLALCVAAAFRLPQLELRPFHGDEANQAVKAGILLETGRYEYDPHEHHGPSLYYAALPLLKAASPNFDATEMWMYRLIPVLFGLLGIAALWLLRGPLGWGGILWAGLLLATSNAMVYYSRYFIQETLLVTFAMLAIAAGYRYCRHPHAGWALLLGISLGFIHATKETSILIFASLCGAAVGALLLGRVGLAPPSSRQDGGASPTLRMSLYLMHAALLLAAAFAVILVLFTAFFTHARGPLDSILTYFTYADRAEGAGSTALHEQPWHYYLGLLAWFYREPGPRWTEAFALALGALGLVVSLAGRTSRDPLTRAFLRFLALYALLLLAVYSLIPYKTPWNLLPFWQPWLMLGGIGAAWLVRVTRWLPLRVAVCALLAAGTAHAGWLAYQGNYVYPADTRNPWVYAHPSTAINRLVQRLDDLAAVHPQGRALHVNILKPDADYWPLPWYLRQYDRVGYWTAPPEDPRADVIIADTALRGYMAGHDPDRYQFEFHALRPNVNLHVYIEKALWETFMEGRR